MDEYYEAMEYEVPPEDEGRVLKSVMKGRMNCSKRLITKLKKTERGITLNGERVFVNVRVKAGDKIALHMEEETSEYINPENIPLEVVYEDQALLVLNKPAGMVVHPTHGHYTGTIANAVMYYAQKNGERYRFRPVHRLDEGTSGLLMVAKHPYAHDQISRQLQQDEVYKAYVAIVEGCPPHLSGTIDAPIDRRPDNPHIRYVTPEGARAVTHYKVLERRGRFTFLHLQLETGRTHQIRVHLQHLGCPIVGDTMYGLPDGPLWVDRPALHAVKLRLKHPMTGEMMAFEAEMPEDMAALWQKELTKLSKQLTIYHYPQCGTCRKAIKWLEEKGHTLEKIHIVNEPPTVEELQQMISQSGLPIQKFFNTSGQVYRQENLKEQLPNMTDSEKIAKLSQNGKLIKRPIVTDGEKVTVGFKDSDFEENWQ